MLWVLQAEGRQDTTCDLRRSFAAGLGIGVARSGGIVKMTITTKGTSIMGEAKPWQIALIVVGLLVFVGMLVFTLGRGDGVDFPNSMKLIDIQNGQLIVSPYRTDRSLVLPAKNESGQRTWYPVVENEDGTYRVENDYLNSLRGEKLLNKEFVGEDGAVKKTTGDPKKVDLYDRKK